MDAREFRISLAALNMNQTDAASLFGVNKATAGRWASGQTPVPYAVAMVLRYATSHEDEQAQQQAITRFRDLANTRRENG